MSKEARHAGLRCRWTIGILVPVVAMIVSPTLPNAGARVAPRVTRVCAAAAPGRAACGALRVVPASGVAPSSTPVGYGPADLASAYKLPAGVGAGRTVAVVDAYDDPNAEADLAVYRTQYGLPSCTTANGCFSKVNQDGAASPLPSPDAGWAAEISLDLDMVSATCPACKILLVEANNDFDNGLFTSVGTAVNLGAVAVSNSWGGPEDSTVTSDDVYFDHPGVAITAMSGDNGYETDYPASSPDVIAVGGTSLHKDGSARGWSETAWGSTNNVSGGSGSGCSQYETKPTWQTDPGCAKRTVADVSAVADPNTAVAVYDSYVGGGGWLEVGGTSVSSPIVASIFAMANRPPADANPARYLYADPTGLFDVVSGVNGTCTTVYLCHAGTGYDGPTGLGTPDGVAAFGPAATPATVGIAPKSGPAGTSVTVTGTGFDAGDRIKVRYKTGLASPKTVVLCHATAAPDGRFVCAGVVPTANAGAVGRHRITAQDSTNPAFTGTTAFKLK